MSAGFFILLTLRVALSQVMTKDMRLGKFNKLTFKEYYHYIDNHKRYADFNVLGLYRSILENDKLNPEERIAVRDYAHTLFHKSFDFLQIKDPRVYFELSYLGVELTEADKYQIWQRIKENQKKILADKRIKHRNFGTYSKHTCGHENCPYNGLMTQKGSFLEYHPMEMSLEGRRYSAQNKSDDRRKDRKRQKLIVNRLLTFD